VTAASKSPHAAALSSSSGFVSHVMCLGSYLYARRGALKSVDGGGNWSAANTGLTAPFGQ
jgi:hypothetical protein